MYAIHLEQMKKAQYCVCLLLKKQTYIDTHSETTVKKENQGSEESDMDWEGKMLIRPFFLFEKRNKPEVIISKYFEISSHKVLMLL